MLEYVFTLLFVCGFTDSRIIMSARQPRLSLAEPMPSYYYTNIDGVPGTYSFGYDTLDPASGNTQYRNEERYSNGTVVGSYGYIDPRGKPIHFTYIADENGYRVSKVPQQLRSPPVSPPVNNIHTSNDKQDSVTWSRKKLQSINENKNRKLSNNVANQKFASELYYQKNWKIPYRY